MPLASELNLTEEADIAAHIARGATKLLYKLQQSGEFEGKELGAKGDKIANDFILSQIRANFPQDAILSEEETDDLARLGNKRVWIIDPLDGTNQYKSLGDDWAVHIGLAIDGKAQLGIVGIHKWGRMFSSAHKLKVPAPKAKIRILTSLSRNNPVAEPLVNALDGVIIKMASAGVKVCAILKGIGDVYVHKGEQFEWDNCAPLAVAEAAGLHISDFKNQPIIYNKEKPIVPNFVVCRKEIAQTVLEAIADFES